mgnify:CR=1 FL=1
MSNMSLRDAPQTINKVRTFVSVCQYQKYNLGVYEYVILKSFQYINGVFVDEFSIECTFYVWTMNTLIILVQNQFIV